MINVRWRIQNPFKITTAHTVEELRNLDRCTPNLQVTKFPGTLSNPFAAVQRKKQNPRSQSCKERRRKAAFNPRLHNQFDHGSRVFPNLKELMRGGALTAMHGLSAPDQELSWMIRVAGEVKAQKQERAADFGSLLNKLKGRRVALHRDTWEHADCRRSRGSNQQTQISLRHRPPPLSHT